MYCYKNLIHLNDIVSILKKSYVTQSYRTSKRSGLTKYRNGFSRPSNPGLDRARSYVQTGQFQVGFARTHRFDDNIRGEKTVNNHMFQNIIKITMLLSSYNVYSGIVIKNIY